MSLNEFDSLMNLMRNPSVRSSAVALYDSMINIHMQSHFLKVPSLPFYCVISLLTKFPTDEESCSLWDPNLLPFLFELAKGTIEFMHPAASRSYNHIF